MRQVSLANVYLLSLFTGEIWVQTFVVFRSPLFAFVKNLNKRLLFMVTLTVILGPFGCWW